jgi:hypothetical protein
MFSEITAQFLAVGRSLGSNPIFPNLRNADNTSITLEIVIPSLARYLRGMIYACFSARLDSWSFSQFFARARQDCCVLRSKLSLPRRCAITLATIFTRWVTSRI